MDNPFEGFFILDHLMETTGELVDLLIDQLETIGADRDQIKEVLQAFCSVDLTDYWADVDAAAAAEAEWEEEEE